LIEKESKRAREQQRERKRGREKERKREREKERKRERHSRVTQQTLSAINGSQRVIIPLPIPPKSIEKLGV